MTDDDPLAGLDDVPWVDLQHSYGMADIVHQGTRSQAAIHTAPFLGTRPAADQPAQNRRLLIAIAIGLDDNYLPNGYDPAEDRTYLTTVQSEAEHLTPSEASPELVILLTSDSPVPGCIPGCSSYAWLRSEKCVRGSRRSSQRASRTAFALAEKPPAPAGIIPLGDRLPRAP